MDVLADVGRIQTDPDGGEVQVHQVGARRDADHRDGGLGQLRDQTAFPHDDQRPALDPGHGLQPHVALVGGFVGAGEVEHHGRLVLAQPGVDGLEHGGGPGRQPAAAQVGGERRDVEEGEQQGERGTGVGGGVLTGPGGDQEARHRGDVEVQHLLARAAHQRARRGVRDAYGVEVHVAGDDRHRAAQPDQGRQGAVRDLETEEEQEAGGRRVEQRPLGQIEPGQQQDDHQLAQQETDGQPRPHPAEPVDHIAPPVVQIPVREVGDGCRRREEPHVRNERGEHDTGVSEPHQQRCRQF